MKVIDEDKQWKSDKSMRLKTPEPLEKTADEYQSRIKKSMVRLIGFYIFHKNRFLAIQNVVCDT